MDVFYNRGAKYGHWLVLGLTNRVWHYVYPWLWRPYSFFKGAFAAGLYSLVPYFLYLGYLVGIMGSSFLSNGDSRCIELGDILIRVCVNLFFP